MLLECEKITGGDEEMNMRDTLWDFCAQNTTLT